MQQVTLFQFSLLITVTETGLLVSLVFDAFRVLQEPKASDK